MKQAVIDIGSNSMRLTLYETNGMQFKILFREKIMAGLAGYVEDGVLSAEGVECACSGLLAFKSILQALEIAAVRVFATASLRNISNTGQALEKIHTAAGYEVEVIKELAARFQYSPYRPRWAENLQRDRSIITQVQEQDRLLFYPYDSVEPFLHLLNEAVDNPQVLSIKITIYRLASSSKIAQALCRAAENGKEVLVLMELRVRFDEENNLAWSKMLEESGCQVIYGTEGFKCHSKICLITLRSRGKTAYLTQIGTGNYNEICCILPGIPGGDTENISVTSVVGRFLEHARIYMFGRGDDSAVYISSADLMTRNLNRRVEIALPVRDRNLKDRLRWVLEQQLKDTAKASRMLPDGTYSRKLGAVPFDSQDNFITQSPHSTAEQKETPVKLSGRLWKKLSGVLKK